MRYRMGDGIWVRLVDVGEALSGRSYSGDGSIVFEVADEFCPWNEGRWKLSGGRAERSKDAADLSVPVQSLGSALLGGVSFAALAARGPGRRAESRRDRAGGRALPVGPPSLVPRDLLVRASC